MVLFFASCEIKRIVAGIEVSREHIFISFKAPDIDTAWKIAEKYGKKSEATYVSALGQEVQDIFVRVIDCKEDFKFKTPVNGVIVHEHYSHSFGEDKL